MRLLALSSALLIVLSGCVYSFTGGGLPRHVRTVAITPIDNETAEPLLETEIQQALQTELPGQLGVRLAEEGIADAIVRGVIRSYTEAPASVRPAQGTEPGTNPAQQPVVAFEVRIGFELEIYDRVNDAILWRGTGQVARGAFDPQAGETAQQGKVRALRELVNKVIEGAQSQW